MKTTIKTIVSVETKEDKREIVWILDPTLQHDSCNLPYVKSFEDWDFYSRSISKALKVFNKTSAITRGGRKRK